MLHCSTTVALGGRAARGGASAASLLGPRPRAEDPRELHGSLLSQTFSLPDQLGRAFGPGSFLSSPHTGAFRPRTAAGEMLCRHPRQRRKSLIAQRVEEGKTADPF